MLNPIFWKKVQGQKHPGMWEIVERQIPSVEMLFKTNTIGHKHRTIRLFIKEKDTIGKPKKTKCGIQHCDGCSFTNTERHPLCMHIYVL